MTTDTNKIPFGSLTVAIDALTKSDSKIVPHLVPVLKAIQERDRSLMPHHDSIRQMFSKAAAQGIRLYLSETGIGQGFLMWAGLKFYVFICVNVGPSGMFPTQKDVKEFYQDVSFGEVELTHTQSIDTRFIGVEIDPSGDMLARFVAIVSDDDKLPSAPVEVLQFEPTVKRDIAIENIIKLLDEGNIYAYKTPIPRKNNKVTGF